jgi:hypothetical protein
LPSLSPQSNISEANDDENSVPNERFHRNQTRQFDIKEFLKLSTPFAMTKNGETAKIKTDTHLKKQVKGKGLKVFRSLSLGFRIVLGLHEALIFFYIICVHA